jgi:hypothetical protein
MRDQAVRVTHEAGDFLDKAGRDLRNRAHGVVAEARGMFGVHPPRSVLIERVRSKLGRYVSHPHAIEVTAQDDRVTLRGPILAEEVKDLLAEVASIPGVTMVVNELEPHEQAGDVPALQGGSPPAGEPSEWAQETWTPGLQLLAGVAAVSILLMALGTKRVISRRRSLSSRTLESPGRSRFSESSTAWPEVAEPVGA